MIVDQIQNLSGSNPSVESLVFKKGRLCVASIRNKENDNYQVYRYDVNNTENVMEYVLEDCLELEPDSLDDLLELMWLVYQDYQDKQSNSPGLSTNRFSNLGPL